MSHIHVSGRFTDHYYELVAQISTGAKAIMSISKGDELNQLTIEEQGIIEASLALIIAQGVNATTVTTQHPIPYCARGYMQELCDIILGASYFTQNLPFQRCNLKCSYSSQTDRQNLLPHLKKDALILWSGGKDALVSGRMLQLANYDISAIHFSANTSVIEIEASAAAKLAERLGISMNICELDWTSIIELIKNTRSNFGIFPFENYIPHGRDILLTSLACIIANRRGISAVCLGYERDLLEKSIDTENQRVWRHDAQSMPALLALSKLASSVWNLKLFSPIAQFSELQVFAFLSLNYPDDWEYVQSCFWSYWCGRCPKCRRYALLEVFMGREGMIVFEKPPLDFNNKSFRSFILDFMKNTDIPFFEQQLMCLDWFMTHPKHSETEIAKTWQRERKVFTKSSLSILTELSTIRPISQANGNDLDFGKYI